MWDALQALMVIKKMDEMTDAKPSSQEARIDAVLSDNNGVITDQENNIEVRYHDFYTVNEHKCYHLLYLGSASFESAMTQTI